MKTFVLSIIITAIQFSILAQYNDTSKIDYFGQSRPGKKVQVFSPDFISRNGWYVQNGCFSQDGKEFVFCRSDSAWHGFNVMYTKYANGNWTEPLMLTL